MPLLWVTKMREAEITIAVRAHSGTAYGFKRCPCAVDNEAAVAGLLISATLTRSSSASSNSENELKRPNCRNMQVSFHS